MDATVVVYTSKWLVAELVRLLHALSLQEAAEVVEGLIERETPWVWSHDGRRRVLKTGLTWKQQVLVRLLSTASRVSEAELVRWLEHPAIPNLRKDVLRPMHRDRLIDYDTDQRTIRLLPPGVTAAEQSSHEPGDGDRPRIG